MLVSWRPAWLDSPEEPGDVPEALPGLGSQIRRPTRAFLSRLAEECLEGFRIARMANFTQGLGLDLSDALAGDGELLSHLF